jgi:CRP/FNR family transcriptional regulator
MPKTTEQHTQTRCVDCPLRLLEIFRDRSPDDVNFLQGFKAGELVVSPGTSIMAQDAKSTYFFTILSGWAFRYRTLEDGRRQIINYGLPGDFLGLQASLSNPMSHGVEALTNIVLCVFPRDKLWNLFVHHPEIAYDITWLAAREERTLDEHLLSIGRKTALERLAYLLWYLFDKARGVGLVKANKLELPMSQSHLADTLGLSLVHTNKTLQKLREKNCIVLDDRTLKIIDEAALKELGRVEAVVPAQRPLI